MGKIYLFPFIFTDPQLQAKSFIESAQAEDQRLITESRQFALKRVTKTGDEEIASSLVSVAFATNSQVY